MSRHDVMIEPSLEQTMREVATNTYLTAILQLAQSHMRHGCGCVDCIDEKVAGDIFEEEEHNSPQTDLMAHIESLTLDQKRAVIPFLRRLGFSVTVFHDNVLRHIPGHAATAGRVAVHPTPPGLEVARRGQGERTAPTRWVALARRVRTLRPPRRPRAHHEAQAHRVRTVPRATVADHHVAEPSVTTKIKKLIRPWEDLLSLYLISPQNSYNTYPEF